MTRHRLTITGDAGRKLEFAVERLRDGAYHRDDGWARPTKGATYVAMSSPGPGRYEARLPELDPEQDYFVHIIDVGTQQLVVSQLVDGSGHQIQTPRVGSRRGRAAVQNRYHGGFVVDVRPGRHVELE
jgi:hypothetical protein